MPHSKTAAPVVVTLTASQLRDLVAPVVPLAGKDESLPLLKSVLIRSSGPYLTATATDRYRMGIKRMRTEEPPPAGLRAVVSLSALKSILSIFKPTRTHNPELRLTFEGDTVRVESGFLFEGVGSASIVHPLVEGDYPPVDRLVRDAIGREQGDAVPVGLNPTLLGDFRHAQQMGEPLILRCSGPKSPVLVHVGEDFIGLVTPIHWAGTAAAQRADDDGWSEVLEPPAKEKAA